MSGQLPVMEDFFTIQGEGFHSGRAAYFIRIGGCDVGCTWCDVKESWEAGNHPMTAISDLISKIKASPTNFVVITGGEPTLYDLEPLTTALKNEGYEIAIETSGAYPITGTFDWICLSPKKFKFPLEENYLKANELKVIAFNNHDFKWCQELSKKVSEECQLFLQPEWGKQEVMLPEIINFVKSNVQWKISLQTHKFMDIP